MAGFTLKFSGLSGRVVGYLVLDMKILAGSKRCAGWWSISCVAAVYTLRILDKVLPGYDR